MLVTPSTTNQWPHSIWRNYVPANIQNSRVDDRPQDNISMDSDSYVTIEERTLEEDELDDDTTTNEQEDDDLKTCLYCGKNEANLKDMFFHMHVTHGIHMKNMSTLIRKTLLTSQV